MTVAVPVWLLMLDGAITLASLGVIYKALGGWRVALARELRLRLAFDVLCQHLIKLEERGLDDSEELFRALQKKGLLKEFQPDSTSTEEH